MLTSLLFHLASIYTKRVHLVDKIDAVLQGYLT